MSMPGEVKDPTQGVNKCVTCSGLTNSRGQLLHYSKFGLFGGNHLRRDMVGMPLCLNAPVAMHLLPSHNALTF